MMPFTSVIKYFIAASVILILFGFFDNPKRYRFLIPKNFTGTVYVYFQVSGAEALKKEDGFQVIVVPDNGVVKTSSELIGGKLHDEYWLYSDGKKYRMSPNKLGGGGTVEQKDSFGQQEIFLQFNLLK
ncbi:MAG TPA: DUF6843 domain-containing protein [Candidatus Wunengus sp. YC61]|uniref:DUF6843 domain-containing protein n=1 Tax=Candidatus Wunengus sp. YC61 TaxID=3367698 RepID=UPI004025381C